MADADIEMNSGAEEIPSSGDNPNTSTAPGPASSPTNADAKKGKKFGQKSQKEKLLSALQDMEMDAALKQVVEHNPWETGKLENEQEAWSSDDEFDGFNDHPDISGTDMKAIARIDAAAAKAVDDVGMQVIRNLKKKLFYSNNRNVYLGKLVHRRTEVIELLRKSYLKDIVTMKLIVNNILKQSEREAVMTQYNACIPCIDMRQALPLHNPESAQMMVKPCETCGGQLEFFISDTARLMKLKKERDALLKAEEQLKITNASLEYKLEMRKMDIYHTDVAHTQEKEVLYVEMRKCKEEVEEMKLKVERLNEVNKELRTVKVEKEVIVSTINVESLQEQLVMAQKDHAALTQTTTALREQMHAAQVEIMELRNSTSRMEDTIKDLNSAKGRVERQLEMSIRDHEMAHFSVTRLTEQNKDLQKSLTQSNEKVHASERRVAAMEFEANALKEKANTDAEDAMRSQDSLRKELQLSEAKLRVVMDQSKDQKEMIAAYEQLIEGKDAIITEMEADLEEASAMEDALEDEIEKMREFLIAAGVSESLFAQFELQHVSGGGLSFEERAQLREERNARFESYKDVLNSQYETMTTARDKYSRKDRSVVVGANTAANAVSAVSVPTSPPKVTSLKLGALASPTPHGSQRYQSGRLDDSPPGPLVHTGNTHGFSRLPSAAGGKLSRLNSIRSSAPPTAPSSRMSSEGIEEEDVSAEGGASFIARGTSQRGENRLSRQFSTDRPSLRKTVRAVVAANGSSSDEKEEIIPLGPSASLMEINMRRTLLSNLIESVGLNTAKKAINATAESVHLFSNMLTAAQTAMWESINMNKRSLDYHIKVKTILEGVLSCSIPGTLMQDVDRVMTEMMPIINMQLGTAFTTEWNAECNLPSTLLNCLNNKGPPTNKTPEFFLVGTNDRELYDRFEMIRSSVGRMSRYSENAYATGSEYVHKTLVEWRDNKSIAIEVQDMLKKEGDRVRQILSKELEGVKVESLKLRRQLQDLMEENSGLVKTIGDMSLDYERLKQFPILVDEKEKDIRELKDVIDELNAKISDLKKDILSHKATSHAANDVIAEKNSSIGLLTFKVDILDKDLTKEIGIRKELEEQLGDTQLELDIVRRREIARWEAGINESIQTEPPLFMDCAIQTEFIQPHLQLRTVIKHSEGKRVPYPVVIADVVPDHYANRDEVKLQTALAQTLDDAMRVREQRILFEQHQAQVQQQEHLQRLQSQLRAQEEYYRKLQSQPRKVSVGVEPITDEDLCELEACSVVSDITNIGAETNREQYDAGKPVKLASARGLEMEDIGTGDDDASVDSLADRVEGIPWVGNSNSSHLSLLADMSTQSMDDGSQSVMNSHISYYAIKKPTSSMSGLTDGASNRPSRAGSPSKSSELETSIENFEKINKNSREKVPPKTFSLSDFPVLTSRSGPINSVTSRPNSRHGVTAGVGNTGTGNGSASVGNWGGKVRHSSRPNTPADKDKYMSIHDLRLGTNALPELQVQSSESRSSGSVSRKSSEHLSPPRISILHTPIRWPASQYISINANSRLQYSDNFESGSVVSALDDPSMTSGQFPGRRSPEMMSGRHEGSITSSVVDDGSSSVSRGQSSVAAGYALSALSPTKEAALLAASETTLPIRENSVVTTAIPGETGVTYQRVVSAKGSAGRNIHTVGRQSPVPKAREMLREGIDSSNSRPSTAAPAGIAENSTSSLHSRSVTSLPRDNDSVDSLARQPQQSAFVVHQILRPKSRAGSKGQAKALELPPVGIPAQSAKAPTSHILNLRKEFMGRK